MARKRNVPTQSNPPNKSGLMPESAEIRKIVPRLLRWFRREARDLPWRRTLDPYAIWISEIMLQQTQVKTVIPYWERWMRELPDVQTLASAPPDRVLKLWEGLGYYTRARNLQKAAGIVVQDYGGRFPDTANDVLALPGIGRYTAGAICSIAFNHPAPILDGNVIRVLCRLFALDKNPRDRSANDHLWSLATALVREASSLNPQPSTLNQVSGSCSALNQSLMELGALVCTPKQPLCAKCPVRGYCEAFQQGRVGELPNLGLRVKSTERRFIAFAIEHRGRWLVRQRPAGVVNGRLWEFLNVEVNGAPVDPASILAGEFDVSSGKLIALPAIRHSITRYRITLEGYRVQLTERPRRIPTSAKWTNVAQLESLAFTSAHRKLWMNLQIKSPGQSPSPATATSLHHQVSRTSRTP